MDEVGKPKYFDINKYLDCVEQMICADEIKFALTMLDNMPGFYRDNPPREAKQIRDRLMIQCMTTLDYINDKSESKEQSEKDHKTKLAYQWKAPHFYPRGPVIVETVKNINKEGCIAHIVELGPYNYWLPAALEGECCEFIYTPININPHFKSPVDNKDHGDKPLKHVFVCLEVIEHLWHENEIFHYAAKTQIDFDYIFISTPKYTCGGGLPNWQTRQLGHIRTWTPRELVAFCEKHWPQHNWGIYDTLLMVACGSKQVL